MNAEDDVTVPGTDESMDTVRAFPNPPSATNELIQLLYQSTDIYDAAGARYLEESPLRMRSKRRAVQFLVLAADTPLKRRKFMLAP